MSDMSIEEAIRILDPETSADAIAEIEYYAGFNKDESIEKVNEACEVACNVMRLFEKLKVLYATEKRKIQYYNNSNRYWNYFNGDKPCCCGSNVHHLEYDGRKIYGVCNGCGKDISEYKDEYVEETLQKGIWK